MIDPGNGRVGPAQIKRAGSDIGGTFGAVESNIEVDEVDIRMDQRGTRASDIVRVGFGANAVIPIAELDLDRALIAFPGEATVGSAGARAIKMGGKIGQQAKRDGLTNLYELIPYRGGVPSTDPEDPISYPAGYERANVQRSFTVDGQQIFAVTVEGLPDDNGHRIIYGNRLAA